MSHYYINWPCGVVPNLNRKKGEMPIRFCTERKDHFGHDHTLEDHDVTKTKIEESLKMNLVINPGNKKKYDFKGEIFQDLQNEDKNMLACMILEDSKKFKSQKQKENFIESMGGRWSSWLDNHKRDHDKLTKIKKLLYSDIGGEKING